MHKDISAEQEAFVEQFHWPHGTHPIQQASLWTDAVLYKWQRDLLEACARPKSRAAASTPNEAGKTSEIIPILGLSIMSAFPGALILSTAGTEQQIAGQLFPYLETKLSKYPEWKISTDKLTVTGPSIDGLRPSRWKGYAPRDAKTAEGYHDAWARDNEGVMRFQPVCYIIDEAKSIRPGIVEAMMRIDPFFALMISTPGDDSGPFYDALNPDTIDLQDMTDDYWTYRDEVSWLQCPHLLRPDKRIVREQIIKRFGENSAFVQSMMFGKFYREGQSYIFDDLNAIRTCMGGMGRPIAGKRAAGLDLSAGSDEQVLYIREGTRLIYSEFSRDRDTYKRAQSHVSTLRKFNVQPEDVVVDVGGVGAPIVNQMEAMGFFGMDRYIVNEDAKDLVQFYNRAAEDHFHLKDLFGTGLVTVDKDDKLLRQMRQRKYIINEKNQIRLQPKKELKDSPDRLDALVMCYCKTDPVSTLGPLPKHKELWQECVRLAGESNESENEDSFFASGMFMEE